MGFRRIVLGVVVFGVLMVWASHAYATALGNTLSRESREAQTISGFSVSNVSYARDPANPGMLSAVGFELNGPATDVRAKVRSAASTYSTCRNIGGLQWSCPIADEAAEADELTVVAVK